MADKIQTPVKPCIKCGACERNQQGKCKACVKAIRSTWESSFPERKKATNAAWRAANKDRIKATNAAWNSANKEHHNALTHAWYVANKDRRKATIAAWNAANPEAKRIYTQNRRAKTRENGGVLSKGLSAKLFKLQRGKCACCKQPLGDNYHMDHIIPISLGGSNTDDNIQLLRQRCNNQKHAQHPIDFMQSRGMLL